MNLRVLLLFEGNEERKVIFNENYVLSLLNELISKHLGTIGRARLNYSIFRVHPFQNTAEIKLERVKSIDFFKFIGGIAFQNKQIIRVQKVMIE